MLSVPDAPTNLHCVENVLVVQWHLYGINTDIGDDAGYSNSDSSFNSLDEACCDFVRHGYLNHHDWKAGALWVFVPQTGCLLSSSTRPLLETLVETHNLKKISFGSLRASELDSRLRKGQNHGGRSSFSPWPDSHSPIIDSSNRSFDDCLARFQTVYQEAYDAFLTAVKELLTYRLSSGWSFIPLGCGTLVWPQHHAFIRDSINATSDNRESHVNTIGIEWLSTGRLLLALCENHLRFHSLPLSTSHVPPHTFKYIFLSPFGIRFPFETLILQDISLNEKRQKSHAPDAFMKAEVLRLLARRRLDIAHDTDWYVFRVRNIHSRLPFTSDKRRLVWPASLVYVVSETPRPNDTSSWQDLHYVSSPFANVSAQVVVSQRRTDLRAAIDGSGVGEEILPDDPYIAFLEGLAELNGPAAVYPTPPQLTRAQVLIPRQSAIFTAPTPATVGSLSGPEFEEDRASSVDHLLSDGLDRSFGAHVDHDDLFGDIGGSILNEDEFGFYDAPRDEVDEPALADVQVDMGAVRPLGITDPTSTKSNEDMSMAIDPAAEQKFLFSSSMLDVETNMNEMTHPVGKDEGTVALKPLPPASEAPMQAGRQCQPQCLDDKYIEGGVFNLGKTDVPQSADPGHGPDPFQGIPRIARPSIDNADTDTSSENSINGGDFADLNRTISRSNSAGNSDTSMEDCDDESSESDGKTAKEVKHVTVLAMEELENYQVSLKNLSAGTGSKLQENARKLKLTGSQYIDLAQMVADQICHRYVSPHPLDVGVNRGATAMTQVLRSSFTNCHVCDLATCARMTKVRPISETTNSPSPFVSGVNFRMSEPDVVLERNSSTTIMSATALSLWNELGLEPVGGPVNIIGYCFVPNVDTWTQGASNLMQVLEETFTSLRLGTHTAQSNDTMKLVAAPGVIGVEPADSLEGYIERLKQTVPTLFQSRSPRLRRPGGDDVLAIYICDPADSIAAIPDYCTAIRTFEDLLRLHAEGGIYRKIIFKIVEPGIVASANAINLPSIARVTSLAHEMYQRCGATSSFALTHLALPWPAKINLQLQPTISRRPFEHDAATHLAYSWSPGGPWLCVAICDDLGKQKWSTCYHCPWEKNVWQRFVAIIRDVWTAISESIESRHGHKLFVAKDSLMMRQEIEAWRLLSNSKQTLKVTVVMLDCECPISLPDLENNELNEKPETSTSTPGTPAVQSPRLGCFGRGDEDLDARLVNPKAEAWGVTGSNVIIRNHAGKLELVSGLACGYFVNEGEVISIRVVFVAKTQIDLKALFEAYYGLGIIAGVCGLGRLLPWHVATARRSREGLTAVM